MHHRIIQRLHKYGQLIRKAQNRSIQFLVWKVYDLLLKRVRKYTYQIELQVISAETVEHIFAKQGITNLGSHLRNRTNFQFFCQQKDEVDIIIRRLCEFDPHYKSNLIRKADRICDHEISILGVGEAFLGEYIDWHKDYRSGLRWGKEYAFDYDFLDMDRSSDVRIVWELSRFHFLIDLGKAYRATGARKYVLKFKQLTADWQENNPVAYSINWAYAMEAAIRSVNLIWALMLFLPADGLDDDFLNEYLRLLILHGRFIFRNLECSDVRGNHYLADLVGLVYLGLFLPEYSEAQKWLGYALPRLDAEMQHQVYPDGVDHEGSIPYHRLVTEMFLSTTILLNRNSISASDRFTLRLEKMLEFVAAYTKPGGLCPLFGDGDDGRLHVLGSQDINDHRYLLSTGAVIFRRADFKLAASRFWEESAWLLGAEGWDSFDRLPSGPSIGSMSFPDGGFYVMRHDDTHLVVDCGDVGSRGRGGHGHNDVLSFTLVLGGEMVIVDTGSSRYTADRKVRRWVLGTYAHNMLVLDDKEIAELIEDGLGSPLNTPTRLIEWHSDLNGDRFVGEHYGYHRLTSPVTHRRTIIYDKKRQQFQFTDSLQGKGRRKIQIVFHFDPDTNVKIVGSCFQCTTSKPGYSYVVEMMDRGELGLERQPVYKRYGVETPSWMGTLSDQVDLPVSIHYQVYRSEEQ